VITFNKDAKRRAKEQQIQDRFDEERGERERAMMDVRESQNRVGRATGFAREGEEELGLTGDDAGAAGGARGRFKSAEQQAATKAQRARYQFEATNSDDEMEDELDGNLDEIHDAVKRMKALGLAMGQEVDGQIKRIERIEDKTTNLDGRVYRNTEKVHVYALVRVCSVTHTPPTAQAHQVNSGRMELRGSFYGLVLRTVYHT
jgi:hypothetical protein